MSKKRGEIWRPIPDKEVTVYVSTIKKGEVLILDPDNPIVLYRPKPPSKPTSTS